MATPAAPGFLSPAERRTLEAVCATLHPSLAPEAGDEPRLFALAAADLGVAAAIESAVAGLAAGERREFRRLLGLLGGSALPLLLAGRPRPFADLPPEARERALRAMAESRLTPLRTGFQVLKRLASFLFYALTPEGGDNPTWAGLGYAPSANPPAAAPALAVTVVDGPRTIEADVCVIGSGAGGGVAAAVLAAAGRRVVVLEAGSGRQAPDFDQSELAGTRDLYLDRGLAATRDLGLVLLAGATLGGGTTVNWQTSLPLPGAVREEWAARSGCSHFTAESFGRSFAAIAERLGLTVEESAVNANNARLRDGCRALGWRWQNLPRNARGCDLSQCGYCVFGCRHGGKQSTARTFLVDAQREGRTAIVAGCRAERVRIEAGRAVGVDAIATTPAGAAAAVLVRAPVVVVAAGGIGSPALLLRSGIELPALGHHLHLHPATAVAGTYDDLVEPWIGPPQSVLCDEHADDGSGYGFRLETAPSHPGLLALATPWLGARDHRREMQESARKSTIIVLVRDRGPGRVRAARDGRPLVDYRPGKDEIRHLRAGIAAASRAHLAAGARHLLALQHRRLGLRGAAGLPERELARYFAAIERSRLDRNRSTLFSAHQMGTCRMGSDRRTAVCDPAGQVFGVRGLYVADGSAFPASSGVNPMLTIMALAHHTALGIAAGS